MEEGQQSSARKEPIAPQWPIKAFEDLRAYAERLNQLLHLSMKGISMVRGVPKLVEALAKVREDSDVYSEQRLEDAKKEAELAIKEVDEGFPLLHAQVTIALWSALEATIRTFLVSWLQNEQSAMSVDVIRRLRVRLGEYESLQGEDRFFFVLDRIEEEVSASLRNGVTRFEVLLEPFGLSGKVDEDVRRTLFELNCVRNALVHRSGLADRRLVEACPWLGLSVGDTVAIDHSKTQQYFAAVLHYSTDIVLRLSDRFGVDQSNFRAKFRPTPVNLHTHTTPQDGLA